MNDNKEKYRKFCEKVNVPVYSKDWWLDAICGEENWDVWLYEKGNEVYAAMPYYMEQRGGYRYITKAPLTQNNGIIFRYPDNIKLCAKAKHEEKIIDAACQFIQNLGIDVYEQQYEYSFKNWLPFYWNQYTAITRYTYVIDTEPSIEVIWDNISSSCRNVIRKGSKNCKIQDGLDYKLFYTEHEKVFKKQGLPCPFSFELWERLYFSVVKNNSGKIMYAENENGDILSVAFFVWDHEHVYLLLGGSMPEFSNTDSYSVLIWNGINMAKEKGLKFDFEGSVIKRISKSFREFGGIPMPYFRIRKVFNKDIAYKECEATYGPR